MAIIETADKYTTTGTKPELFSDFGMNFGLHPGKKDLVRVVNENAVKKSIQQLLLTDYFERMYQPTLGANLKYLLFEPATEDTLVLIQDHISSCITKFEPRANLLRVVSTLSPDEHYIYVTILFSLINQSRQITLDFVLTRVR
jgi:phage baseplate assembly protein W